LPIIYYFKGKVSQPFFTVVRNISLTAGNRSDRQTLFSSLTALNPQSFHFGGTLDDWKKNIIKKPVALEELDVNGQLRKCINGLAPVL
jgi:hypothetical protein